ncbi:unnamed protein product [Closterium sp. NIES-53]
MTELASRWVQSIVASALVAELLDFAAAYRLDYATALVAESESASPPSVGGECALGTDVLEDSSPSRANIVDGMWIFRGVDYFQNFSPTPKMTTLRVLLHVAAQCDYELHSLDFSTAFLQGSLHEEIWLRCPPGFTGTTLAALGFAPSTTDPSLFLLTNTSLPPFYVLVYVDELVFSTAENEALTLVKLELHKRHTCTDLGPSALCLPVLLATAHSSVYQPLALSSTFGRVRRAECTSGMGLMLGGQGPVVLTGHANASWVDDSATQQSSQGYTFSLGSGSVSWWSTRLSSVLSSSCEAEIYAGAMAAQELRWLTYLLTDLGVQPPSPPFLYQHGQLRLAYVATRVNTADIFTKALPPGDHQRFSTVLGLLALLFLTGLVTTCSPPLCLWGEVWGNGGSCRGVDAVKPAAPVACETVAPVAHEPVAPVARELVTRAARLAAEPVTPVAHVPVAPFASVPVAPVARVPATSAATHHLLSSHGPSSSLALSFLHCSWCTPSGGVVHKVLHYRQLGEPLGAVSTMAGPMERGGRGAIGSGEAQAQGQPCESAMAPMQPSLGPPRDEPRVFGLDKFNGDNFAEWSFKMENIFDHYDLLEVMEGTEKRPENDPEKSLWVRKSAQGYLLLGQALGSSQIRHIKPFQREPEKGPKAWAAFKGVHAPATAAVAVVLERQMAALRIEEDEAVEEGVQKFFNLLTRLEGAVLNYSELQNKTKLLALLPESWSSLIINLNRDLPRLSLEDVKRAILQEDFRRRELASADGAGAASIRRGYGHGRGRGRGGGRFGGSNFNGGRGSSGYGNDNKNNGRGRGRFDGECHFCHKSGHMWCDCYKLPDGWTSAQVQEDRGVGGGRGRGRGGCGGRRGGAASMKSAGNESESRDDRFPGQFFFVSTQAPAGPEKDEGFEEPAAVGKVTLHSLDYWVIDNGATYSMTPRADLLTELEPSPVKHVTSALGQRAEVKGMGKAMFKGADGKMVGLKNVLWVPNLAANLISVRRLQKAGMDTSSKGAKTYTARLGERILSDLHKDRDVYNEMWQIPVVPMPKERQVAASSTEGEAVGSGDGAKGRAKEIKSKKCNLGVTSKLGEHEESGAAAEKQHKDEENPKAAAEEEYGENISEATAKAPLDEVVMDVVGPLKLGAAGSEYILTIVDVYTRMTWVYVLSKKSDVVETVKTDWLPMVERQQDRLVKANRTDRGGEFLSKEFSLWLKKNGIRHSLTMPYSPAMNGIAERANRTITETARGLLIEAGLPEYLWPDAVRSACVTKNRALTHVGVDKWVPYVEWIGRKPKVDMLRVFGCMCMALVPKHLRHNKLGAKAIWAVENEAKIGMRFGEVKSSGLEHVELSSSSTTTRQSSLVNGGEEVMDAKEEEEEVQQVRERALTLPSRTTSAPRIRVTPQQCQGLHVPAAEEEGRGKRRIQAPNRLTYDALGKPAKSALAGAALIVGDDEESEWKKAMESELKSIEENDTWELVELPEGRKAITSKWLFKIKSDADGKIER